MKRESLHHASTAALAEAVEHADGQTPARQEQMAASLAAYWQSLWTARSPRYRPGSQRLDGRRTVRQVVRHGGVLAQVSRRRRQRPRRLIILADCSESTILRPGVLTMVSALSRVGPGVVTLGFDVEVFSLQPLSVTGLTRVVSHRSRVGRRLARRSLTIARLDEILAQSRRHATSPTQCSCVIVSDLFLQEGDTLDGLDPKPVRRHLDAFAAVWLIDTWPAGAPFEESVDGWVTCSARALLDALRREAPHDNAMLSWREAETTRRWRVDASALERVLRFGDRIALRARRGTQFVRAIGFEEDRSPSGRRRLVHLPMATVRDVTSVFRRVDHSTE